VNAADLPIVGPICNVEKNYLPQLAHLTKLTAARVLCVGFSQVEIDELIAPHHPAEIISLTHWVDHIDAAVSRYPLVVGDLCAQTDFPPTYFDHVVTLSVLEHLRDLDGACREVKRILRRDGWFLSFFGPAWSCAYGHHLYANPDDPNLNFTSWQLPAHMHLLCSPQEISDWYLQKGYSPEIAQSVQHWFFETNLINRLSYDAYLSAFQRHFRIAWMEGIYNTVPTAHLDRLRAKLGPGDYSTYGGKFALANT